MMRRKVILTVVMLMIASLSATSLVRGENFYEKSVYKETGVIFTSVAIGDLDNDGINEAVAVGYSTDTNPRAFIEILSVTQSGFVADFGQFYDQNTYFYDVIVGDFDGDGIKEIAVCGSFYDSVIGAYTGVVKIFSYYQGFSEESTYEWNVGYILADGDTYAKSIIFGNVSHSGIYAEGIVVAYNGYDKHLNAPITGIKILDFNGTDISVIAEKEYLWTVYNYVEYTDVAIGDADSNGDYEILASGYYIGSETVAFTDLFIINSTGGLELVDTATDTYTNSNMSVASAVVIANLSGSNRIYLAEYLYDNTQNKTFVGIAEKAFDGSSINDVTNLFWSYYTSNASAVDLVSVDFDSDGKTELVLASNFWDNISTAAVVAIKNMSAIYSYYPYKIDDNSTHILHILPYWVDVDGNSYPEGILCGYFGNSSITGYLKILEWDELSPSIPIPQNPVDEWFNATTINFAWSQSTDSQSGVYGYQVQIATDSSFNNIVAWINTTLNTTQYTLPEGRYYWRVRAIDNTQNPSNWSVICFFGIDLTPPPAPQLLSPQNDSVLNYTPTLTWRGVNDTLSGVKYYEVMVDDNPSFSSPIVDIYTASTNYSFSSNLTQGTYYWKVRAIDNVNNVGIWSSVYHFTIALNPPPSPTLLSPTNNTWFNIATLTFDWTDVSGQVATAYYEMEIDVSMNFTSPTKYNTTASQITISNITEGWYYWRVRAIDVANNTGMWSDIWCFGVDITPPEAPQLVYPDNNTLLNDTTINFVWNAVSDLSGIQNYTFEIADNPIFVNSTVVKTRNTTVALSLPSGKYYWRVKAQDNAGNTGNWSDVWTVNVDVNAPAAPILLYPSDNSWIGNSRPTFQWENSSDDFSGVAYYEIEVDSDPNFASPVIKDTTTANNYTPSLNLSDGTYYWRVRAVDVANNTGSWSQVFVFFVDTSAPAPPTGIAPINIILNYSLPQFSWTAADDNGSGVDYYEIQVSTSPDFSVIVISDSTTETFYNASTPLPDGTYYWRVRAVDSVGNIGAWSDGYTFTIDTTPPSPPQLLSPSNGEYLSSSPQLMWNESTDMYAGVDHYEIQVSTTSDFSNIVVEDSTLSTSYTLPQLADGTYYWRVRAVDSVGNIGTWSDVFSFSIDSTPPTTPQLISPDEGALLNITHISLSWSTASDDGSGVDHYEIQISTSPDFAHIVVQESTQTNSYETDLSDGTYYWRVRAVDSVGNAGDWSDVYSFIVDTTPPAVISATPIGNAVPPTSNITVKFSENIDVNTAKEAFIISPSVKGVVVADNDTVTFVPSSDLEMGRTYTVTIRGVKDIAGNVMSNDYNWSFTVAAPDLEISVSVEKKEVVHVGDNITFEITVSNIGTWIAENSKLIVYKGDEVYQEIQLGDIAVGGEKTEIVVIQMNKAGNITFRFVAQCEYDTNSENNEYSQVISVKEKPAQMPPLYLLLLPLLLLIIIILLVIFFWKRRKEEVPVEEKGKEAEELAKKIEEAAEKQPEKPEEKIEDLDIEELLK